MDHIEPQAVFLSYNSADKELVRKLAASLSVAGAQVWFDEWTVRPGDSIPGQIDKGLTVFSSFALVWSLAASTSRWVRTEMDAAIAQWLADPARRLVPIRLDDTPLPAILQHIRYIDARERDTVRVARELLGFETESAFRLAVQQFISEAGLDFREFRGVGVLVACPKCGATPENLEAWSTIDHEHDRSYIGVNCNICGWSGWSEK
jgi:hypothetical protein